jgi:hypothetical protein
VRLLFVAALIAASPAAADDYPTLHLCPTTVVNTCFVGYLTAPDRMIVLLSTSANDPLINREVGVHIGHWNGSGRAAQDLRADVGRVVMLDAIGTDDIEQARVAAVADPLLTALYLALAAPTHGH